MENKKVGFVLYLDNYPMLLAMPSDQRGWLLLALYVYADRLSREEEVSMEEVMAAFPQLTEQARVACGFMGANICRDTQKWFAQRRARMERKSRQGDSGPARSLSDHDAVVREDMERMRRLMQEERERGRQGDGRQETV